MDVQGVITTAISANAVTLGTPYASEWMRDAFRSAIQVPENLTNAEMNYLVQSTTARLLFTGKHNVENDHPLLCAQRTVIREIHDQLANILATTQKVLTVGAAAREVRKYKSNRAVHYWFHNSEGKDYDRIVRPLLESMVKDIQKKAKKKNPKVFLSENPSPEEVLKSRGPIKRYYDMRSLVTDYELLNKCPDTMHVGASYLKDLEAMSVLREKYGDSVDGVVQLIEEWKVAAPGYAQTREKIFKKHPKLCTYVNNKNKKYKIFGEYIYNTSQSRYMDSEEEVQAAEVLLWLNCFLDDTVRWRKPKTIVAPGVEIKVVDQYPTVILDMQTDMLNKLRGTKHAEFIKPLHEIFEGLAKCVASIRSDGLASDDFYKKSSILRSAMNAFFAKFDKFVKIGEDKKVEEYIKKIPEDKKSKPDTVIPKMLGQLEAIFLAYDVRRNPQELKIKKKSLFDLLEKDDEGVYLIKALCETGLDDEQSFERFVSMKNFYVNRLEYSNNKVSQKLILKYKGDVYNSVMQLIEERNIQAENLKLSPDQVKKIPLLCHAGRYDILNFEDSAYNYDEEAFTHLFKVTGAKVAYGYMMLPYELHFKEMPTNEIYYYEETYDYVKDGVHLEFSDNPIHYPYATKYSTLTYRNGYANGYCHKTNCWSTLMNKHVLEGNGVKIGVEITSRVGTMAMFKLFRITDNDVLVRTIELPPFLHYVRVLDLYSSVDKNTGRVNQPLQYFSAYAEDIEEVVNYLQSIDDKSLTFTNTMSFMRRKKKGVTLAGSSKEIISKLRFQTKDMFKIALACTLHVMILRGIRTDILANAQPLTIWDKFKSYATTAVRFLAWPLTEWYDWVVAGMLTDKIVLYEHDWQYTQRKFITFSKDLKVPIEYQMHSYANPPDDNEDCPFCYSMADKKGEQIFDCQHKEKSDVTFGLTQSQLDKFILTLMDTDHDPPGLAKVKELAKSKVPRKEFKHTCRVEYIRGGPGTGKSYIIRAGYDPQDLVMAPFSKLLPDYLAIDCSDGVERDAVFKTNHRALGEIGHSIIWVDEMSSMPYEYVAIAAFLNKAKVVYLVGDHKQTRVQEPQEGMYIGNYVEFDKLSQHELLVNFRNPRDTVHMLNSVFGYNMYPKSTVEKSMEVIKFSQYEEYLAKYPGAISYCFTRAEALKFLGSERETVRSNQGGTTKVSFLVISGLAGTVAEVESLQIVSGSRHSEKMIIVADDSPAAAQLIQKFGGTNDFQDHVGKHFYLPENPLRMERNEDLEVEIILKSEVEKTTSDAYLHIPELVDPLALCTELNYLNEDSSHIILKQNFKTGRSNEDDIINPVNIRGHPEKTDQTYHSMGPGMGKLYNAKDTMQEIASVNERYDKPKATLPFDDKAKKLAEAMVDRYFAEFKDPSKLGVLGSSLARIDAVNPNWADCMEMEEIADEDLEYIAQEFIKDALKKGYHKHLIKENDDSLLNTVRYHLKDIYKPETTTKAFDLSKVGQGISAWDPQLQAEFCMTFRILKFLDVRSDLNTNTVRVCNPHQLSEEKFTEEVTKAYGSVFTQAQLKVIRHAICDIGEMDAGQNEFTQYIERLYWAKFGVSESYLNRYYLFRQAYHLSGTAIEADVKFVKTSGEPGTLANNEIVAKVVDVWCIDWKGPIVACQQGDDGNYSALTIQILDKNVTDVKLYCTMKPTFKISDRGEFCGKVVSPYGVFPNIVRKLNKIIGNKIKDYEHFTQVQTSLRDWIGYVKKAGLENTITACMANSDLSYNVVFGMWEAIDSVSHMDKAAFENVFPKITIQRIITTCDDGKSGYLVNKD